MDLTSLSHQCRLDPAARLSVQIGLARELALSGAGGPARQICGSVFLEHAPLLSRDEALLGAFVECLLLLEMTALLARVVQTIFGVPFGIAAPTAPGPRRWVITIGTTVTMAMVAPRTERRLREQSAARWSATILEAATRETAGLALAAETQSPPAAARNLDFG